MRFRSQRTDGFQIFAVAGINTVSFAVTATAEARRGLLGFAIERASPQEDERYLMPGFKVFESIIPNPSPSTQVSTWEHPIQSFVWDDFTAKPGHAYEYVFHPLRGAPRNLDRTAAPVSIQVRTEPDRSEGEHDVFFNRGVASSQAYARRFGNKSPDELTGPLRDEALQWLTRDLDEAIARFIDQAGPSDTLLCCFYEFRYRPVADALALAVGRGVDVRILVDAKVNERTDKDGKFHESFPREDNLRMIEAAGLPDASIVLREARAGAIAHNKFMVFLEGQGAGARPRAVWTGSTNISRGGIAGQTNVGHWIRNDRVAGLFRSYWDLLRDDPGGARGDGPATVRAKNAAFRAAVEALGPAPTRLEEIPAGVTPIFSPRSTLGVLDLYFALADEATSHACITLAFGISDKFKRLLKDNTDQQALVFMLLEKEDRPATNGKASFIAINASNNVYKAWGSFINDPIYRWTWETNARRLGLNTHVSYIHSKFLLRDPLGGDPIVVTGSANFSEASTRENDENMIVIRGSTRVADIYFTEFHRLFNHYYFRSVYESLARGRAAGRPPRPDASKSALFLAERADDWLKKYVPGTFRSKRVRMFAEMEGFTTP